MCELDDEVGVAVLGLLAARVGALALPGMGAFFSGKGVGAVDRMVCALRACFAELRAGADSWGSRDVLRQLVSRDACLRVLRVMCGATGAREEGCVGLAARSSVVPGQGTDEVSRRRTLKVLT